MTRVVLNRTAGVVYIGRAGKGESGYFGNPFRVGAVCSRCKQFHADARSTIPCFKAYFNERMSNDPIFQHNVLNLRGRDLWCPGYCKRSSPNAPCHGDVYVEFLEKRTSTLATGAPHACGVDPNDTCPSCFRAGIDPDDKE